MFQLIYIYGANRRPAHVTGIDIDPTLIAQVMCQNLAFSVFRFPATLTLPNVSFLSIFPSVFCSSLTDLNGWTRRPELIHLYVLVWWWPTRQNLTVLLVFPAILASDSSYVFSWCVYVCMCRLRQPSPLYQLICSTTPPISPSPIPPYHPRAHPISHPAVIVKETERTLYTYPHAHPNHPQLRRETRREEKR